MCRCPVERRYLMTWSSEKELKSTFQRVRDHCNFLKVNQDEKEDTPVITLLPPIAIGAERDQEEHKNDLINVEPCGGNTAGWYALPVHEDHLTSKSGDASDAIQRAPEVTSDEDKGEDVIIDDTDDEVQVVGVRDANSTSY